jgi:hypothetical protein
MNRPIDERDEFLLSRLVDDDLPADEAAALRTRIEREPDLRNAYSALTRIDSLLVARRTDQPAIDWARFHRGVMEQVEGEALVAAARPKVIRLADYLRVALPLAAAAAIALVVWAWPHGNSQIAKNRVDTPRPTLVAENRTPEPSPIEIRFSGRDLAPAGNGIHVVYARSDELQNEIRQQDEADRRKEPSHLSFASQNRPSKPVSPDLLIEASSLF